MGNDQETGHYLLAGEEGFDIFVVVAAAFTD